jgi:recombinational DNA repair protein RecT
MDNGFVGGYMYLPDGELYIMTKKQILTAWSKSSSREQTTHKQFDEKMVQKTLVNSGCNIIINSTPEYQIAMDEETNLIENKLPDNEKYEEFAEAEEIVDEATPVAIAQKNEDLEF